jgi:sortase A
MTLVNASPPAGPRIDPVRGGSTWEEGRPVAVQDGRQRRPAGSPRALVASIAGTTLWILALCLLGFVLWFAFLSRLHYDRIQVESYANFRAELALATAPTGPTNPADPQQLLAPGTAIGVLNIPDIGLTTVIFEGTTGQVLESGPGLLRDTPLPGQPGVSVIFGRRAAYGGPFSRLPWVQVGEVFTVTTGQGVASYRVIDLRRAGDPVPPAPAAGQGRLILVTADGPPLAPFGVLRIDADLISKPVPAPTMVISAADLSPSEQVLGTDPNALEPIVLWGALLLGVSALVGWTERQWGRWQTWIVAVPVVLFVSLSIADQVACLLPNLM